MTTLAGVGLGFVLGLLSHLISEKLSKNRGEWILKMMGGAIGVLIITTIHICRTYGGWNAFGWFVAFFSSYIITVFGPYFGSMAFASAKKRFSEVEKVLLHPND